MTIIDALRGLKISIAFALFSDSDKADWIVQAIARRPDKKWFPAEIAEDAGISLSALYPSLAVLERDGLIKSDWEHAEPGARRRYWATERGIAKRKARIDEVRALWGWNQPNPVKGEPEMTTVQEDTEQTLTARAGDLQRVHTEAITSGGVPSASRPVGECRTGSAEVPADEGPDDL